MTHPAFLLLSILCVVALGDWLAVLRGYRGLEYLCKPLATLTLIGVALAVDPIDDTVRMWFVVALLLSLAGDVFLMLPRDLFVLGLTAFLLALVAYTAGMSLYVSDLLSDASAESRQVVLGRLGIGAVVALAGVVTVGTRIVLGARRRADDLAGPVVVYMLVMGATVTAAAATGRPAAIIGALLFAVSDSLLGWGRFVRPALLEADRGRPARLPVAVMVTYHLGQAGLVLSLATRGLWALLGLMAVMAIALVALLD